MLKPPHPVARIAYAMSLWLNPNNHALDGGRASSAMEKEAVAAIARMFGWDVCLGHLCGGGTIANFEALWVSRELAPGKAIAASTQAHYTHSRLSAVLGVPFRSVDVHARGPMAVAPLARALDAGLVRLVVVALGSPAAGTGERRPEVRPLREGRGFRLLVAAASGGYYTLAGNLEPHARAACDLIRE